MVRNLDAIIVPTGKKDAELERYAVAKNRAKNEIPLILSGMNNVNAYRVKYYREDSIKGDDDHLDLFDKAKADYEAGEILPFGLDIYVDRTKGNMKRCFPLEQKGVYGFVSNPWHLFKARTLEFKFKLLGKMSRDVTITYIPTKAFREQSSSEHGKGILGLMYSLVFDW